MAGKTDFSIAESPPPPPPMDATGVQEGVRVVECQRCHRLHRIEKKTYVRVAGNITIGQDGGIVGNHFVRWNGLEILRGASIFCCDCLIEYLQESFNK